MHLTGDERRRVELLEWLVNQGTGQHLLEQFYGDALHDMRVTFSDVKALEASGLVSATFGGGGNTRAEATPDGRSEIERIHHARSDRGQRRVTCRMSLLQWLDAQGAYVGTSYAPTWDGLFADIRANFHGETFTAEEVEQAAAWLHRHRFIDGPTVEEVEGPIRASLTDEGSDLLEHSEREIMAALVRTTQPLTNQHTANAAVDNGLELFDVFICHASEDKATVATRLAIELRNREAVSGSTKRKFSLETVFVKRSMMVSRGVVSTSSS